MRPRTAAANHPDDVVDPVQVSMRLQVAFVTTAVRRLSVLAAASAVTVAFAAGCDGARSPPALLKRGDVTFVPAPRGTEVDTPVWLPGARRLVVTVFARGQVDDPAYNDL